MSLTLIPGRGRARHRGKSGLQLQRELAAAERKITALTAGNDQLRAERNQLEDQLDQAGIDLSIALDDLRLEREETARLRAELAPYKAAKANANRVDVPPMVRDTSAIEDQATGPIDVRALWEARDAGVLGPVTDPGHVRPSWAIDDEGVAS